MNLNHPCRLPLWRVAVLFTAPLLAFWPLRAPAQAWPSKPITIVVPAAPGVAPDIYARLYAEELRKSLNVSVIVENKPGAGGIIGTDAAAKAAADGHTILWGFNSLFTMNPHLYGKLPYTVSTFAPVTQHINGAYFLVANNDVPAKSLSELLALAKAQPGKLTYASFGAGTAAHLAMELIESAANVSLLHVPYKQGAVTDVMGGQVNLIVQPSASVLPLIKSGKVRALAYTGPKRSEALPDVPTIQETLPGVSITGWHGIWVPAATPPDIVARLNSEFVRITRTPEMQKRIRDGALEPSGTSPQETADIIQRESQAWAKVISERKIKID